MSLLLLVSLGASRVPCLEWGCTWLCLADEVGHALGRRLVGLGTPVPRTPTVAPRPKARLSWLPGKALRTAQSAAGPKRLRARLAHVIRLMSGVQRPFGHRPSQQKPDFQRRAITAFLFCAPALAPRSPALAETSSSPRRPRELPDGSHRQVEARGPELSLRSPLTCALGVHHYQGRRPRPGAPVDGKQDQ